MALIGVRSFRATKEENFGIQRKINQFEHDAIKGARIRIWEIITIFSENSEIWKVQRKTPRGMDEYSAFIIFSFIRMNGIFWIFFIMSSNSKNPCN